MKRQPPAKGRCLDVIEWFKIHAQFHRDGEETEIPPAVASNLGALTGTDRRALAAAVHIIELFAVVEVSHEDAILEAFHNVVMCMQPSTRDFAYHAIAQVTEWEWREKLWERSGLASVSPIVGGRS